MRLAPGMAPGAAPRMVMGSMRSVLSVRWFELE